MSGGLSGASGYSRGPSGASWGLRLLPGLSGASWGLRLLPGPLWGLLGPPVTPGALWGLLGPPVTPGALWGLLGPPVTPGALSLPAKPIWRWCGSVRVGAPLGSAGKKRAAPRALLPVDAGPRGGERRRPRGGRATAPWLVPSLNIVKKSGGGLLESALWLRNRAQHVGAVALSSVAPGKASSKPL